MPAAQKTPRPRELTWIDLDTVEGAPLNPKGHDDAGIDASMDRFGYVEPMVRDGRTGRLVVGHGRLTRLRARKDAGQAPPEGIVVDGDRWMLGVLDGWESRNDIEAEAYLIASNELTTRGGWEDRAGLTSMLQRIAEDITLLPATGFTVNDVADLVAHLDPPPSLDDLEKEYGDPDPAQLWPVLRFKVAPTARDRYLRLVEGVEGGDDVLFDHLLTLAERP